MGAMRCNSTRRERERQDEERDEREHIHPPVPVSACASHRTIETDAEQPVSTSKKIGLTHSNIHMKPATLLLYAHIYTVAVCGWCQSCVAHIQNSCSVWVVPELCVGGFQIFR